MLDVIVVVCDGAREHIGACLESLRRHAPTAGPMAVHVVDNASTDGTAELVLAEFPEVRLDPDVFQGERPVRLVDHQLGRPDRGAELGEQSLEAPLLFRGDLDGEREAGFAAGAKRLRHDREVDV